jgi:hypothetical protein
MQSGFPPEQLVSAALCGTNSLRISQVLIDKYNVLDINRFQSIDEVWSWSRQVARFLRSFSGGNAWTEMMLQIGDLLWQAAECFSGLYS